MESFLFSKPSKPPSKILPKFSKKPQTLGKLKHWGFQLCARFAKASKVSCLQSSVQFLNSHSVLLFWKRLENESSQVKHILLMTHVRWVLLLSVPTQGHCYKKTLWIKFSRNNFWPNLCNEYFSKVVFSKEIFEGRGKFRSFSCYGKSH